MAFTTTQLAALEEAIARGVLTVRYQDRTVTYNSISEMLKLRSVMLGELNAAAGQERHARAVFSRD